MIQTAFNYGYFLRLIRFRLFSIQLISFKKNKLQDQCKDKLKMCKNMDGQESFLYNLVLQLCKSFLCRFCIVTSLSISDESDVMPDRSIFVQFFYFFIISCYNFPTLSVSKPEISLILVKYFLCQTSIVFPC